MNIFYNIFGFVLLLVLVIMMSMMVRWGIEQDIEKKQKWSCAWHSWSVYFRAGALVLWIVTNWGLWIKFMILLPWFFVICWPVWDGIIALHLNRDFWYIGTTSKIDKIFTKNVSKILKIILIFSTMLLSILYFLLQK
jgi:hypothetical protein